MLWSWTKLSPLLLFVKIFMCMNILRICVCICVLCIYISIISISVSISISAAQIVATILRRVSCVSGWSGAVTCYVTEDNFDLRIFLLTTTSITGYSTTPNLCSVGNNSGPHAWEPITLASEMHPQPPNFNMLFFFLAVIPFVHSSSLSSTAKAQMHVELSAAETVVGVPVSINATFGKADVGLWNDAFGFGEDAFDVSFLDLILSTSVQGGQSLKPSSLNADFFPS